MITNSAYTEARLHTTGLTCPFERVVGGVNTAALKAQKLPNKMPITIFCAARFVPYKNHSVLISLIHELNLRGHDLVLRLAGDGPLLVQILRQVQQNNLDSIVKFLGVLDNKQTCQEIAQAHIYMQLSADQMTEVPGGSYIHSEGMGRSILEALTAGTFVIAGNSGALSEIVTKDRGLVVDLDNVGQITEKVEHILKNLPPRQPFINDYCWANIFKRYEKILKGYHENIAGHRKMWSH
jgi:glycosyltransferase involved in cell wall biosynthesis